MTPSQPVTFHDFVPTQFIPDEFSVTELSLPSGSEQIISGLEKSSSPICHKIVVCAVTKL
ncbi:MAG: hypothetical protein LUC26_03035 [Prevotella sp.]|nr:hypothetical protein [Prevotella sp.]